jgi:hypothetical protein
MVTSLLYSDMSVYLCHAARNISAGVMFESPNCSWARTYIHGITHFIYTSFVGVLKKCKWYVPIRYWSV